MKYLKTPLTNYCVLVGKALEEAGEDYINKAGNVLIPTLAPTTTESIVCQGKSDGDKCYRGCLEIIHLAGFRGFHTEIDTMRCKDTFGKCSGGICGAIVVYPGPRQDMWVKCPHCGG